MQGRLFLFTAEVNWNAKCEYTVPNAGTLRPPVLDERLKRESFQERHRRSCRAALGAKRLPLSAAAIRRRLISVGVTPTEMYRCEPKVAKACLQWDLYIRADLQKIQQL